MADTTNNLKTTTRSTISSSSRSACNSEAKAFPFFLATSSSSTTLQSVPKQEQPPTTVAPPDPAALRAKEQAKYKANCDKYVESGLRRNVTVQFLLERLSSMGCTPPQGFIRCMDCGDKLAGGGFGVVEEILVSPPRTNGAAEHEEQVRARAETEQCHRTTRDLAAQLELRKEGKTTLRLLPEIFLCQQHLVSKKHAHQCMVHELIHAVDLCRTKMDPISNCIHMACTEIRAENLSGECGFFQELKGGRIQTFKGHGAECVKRRAVLSVKANPNCTDRANEYVDATFDRCFKDTFPFDRHPNLR